MEHIIEKQEGNVLDERKKFILFKNEGGCSGNGIQCDANSVSGAVSQRACVYCGARVVLNPITDAFHIVHGPIGCSSYTWDIRGSLSSDEEIYRNSFSTDLRETDVIFGGEKKLSAAIEEIVAMYQPKLIFVYATCIVGVIGDDVEAVCKEYSGKYGIDVIPVKSPGFSGNKSTGYRMACNAIMEVIRRHRFTFIKSEGCNESIKNLEEISENNDENSKNNDISCKNIDKNSKNIDKSSNDKYDFLARKDRNGINILGDFNLAGEIWIIRSYLNEIGIPVVSTFTGDSSYESLIRAQAAVLNVVQCAGSSTYLAKLMEEELSIPFIKVSFFGIEDTTDSLIRIAEALGNETAREKAIAFTNQKISEITDILEQYRSKLSGKKAAIYVGGGFKAISLIRQFRYLGIETVVVGTQTGKKEDYDIIESIVKEDTVILDDANPAELETFMKEKGADILVGGVKERPLAYKLGIAFCDHNHERKHALAGFEGVINFAKEISSSMNHPVWDFLKEEGI